jgi:hypothetical protein
MESNKVNKPKIYILCPKKRIETKKIELNKNNQINTINNISEQDKLDLAKFIFDLSKHPRISKRILSEYPEYKEFLTYVPQHISNIKNNKSYSENIKVQSIDAIPQSIQPQSISNPLPPQPISNPLPLPPQPMSNPLPSPPQPISNPLPLPPQPISNPLPPIPLQPILFPQSTSYSVYGYPINYIFSNDNFISNSPNVNNIGNKSNIPMNNQQIPMNNQQIPMNNQQIPMNNQQIPMNNQQIPMNNQQSMINNNQQLPNNQQNNINLPGGGNIQSTISQNSSGQKILTETITGNQIQCGSISSNFSCHLEKFIRALIIAVKVELDDIGINNNVLNELVSWIINNIFKIQ